MKKAYQAPTLSIVDVAADTPLMAASGYEQMTFGGESTNTDVGEAKGFTGGSLWEDEDE